MSVQSEALMDDYVANDIKFSDETSRLAILTGPNMAGESRSDILRFGER